MLTPTYSTYGFTDRQTQDQFVLNIFSQQVSTRDLNPEVYTKFISPKALLKHWKSSETVYKTTEGYDVSKLTLSALSDIWPQMKKSNKLKVA